MLSLDEFKELYPDISKDYYFYRIIYWKLEMSHNVAIPRDDTFFSGILPILEDTWNKIQTAQKDKLISEDDKFRGKDELQ